MGETWQGARSEKKRTYLESQDVAQFGAMNLWEDSVHHEIIARFIIFHMSASKNQIFCIFLHTIIFKIMHNHKLAQKLHFFDTVNASRNRAFANYFLFARSANAWNKLAVRYKHVAYTGHAVSFRGPGCSRQTQFPRSRPRKLPKNVKMLKTQLVNCSPLFALHQLILHRQLLFSAGCIQRENNNVVFRKKD